MILHGYWRSGAAYRVRIALLNLLLTDPALRRMIEEEYAARAVRALIYRDKVN